MQTREDFAAARDRGAAFLDEKEPGWAAEITLPLRMSSCFACVLGQLCGHYTKGTERFSLTFAQAVDLGFAISLIENRAGDLYDQFAILDDLWRDAITSRLTPAE